MVTEHSRDTLLADDQGVEALHRLSLLMDTKFRCILLLILFSGVGFEAQLTGEYRITCFKMTIHKDYMVTIQQNIFTYLTAACLLNILDILFG